MAGAARDWRLSSESRVLTKEAGPLLASTTGFLTVGFQITLQEFA